MSATVTIKIDISGNDGIPHTFLDVVDSNGTHTEYGLVPADHSKDSLGGIAGDGRIDITGPGAGKDPHESQYTGPTETLTDDQYNKLMDRINQSIQDPPKYILPGSGWPGDGTNCTGWVGDVWKEVGLPQKQGITDASNPYEQAGALKLGELFDKVKGLIENTDPQNSGNNSGSGSGNNDGYTDTGTSCDIPGNPPIGPIREGFDNAENTRSPLVLDLDGDGVETLAQTNILFDHDANEFAELTGWVGKDDGLLVLDKNADGKITSGTELFGNNTVLANGNKADNGFSALADLDTNKDSKVDALDTAFNNLRVWKDLDSDGLTDTGELIDLATAGVKSINLTYSVSSEVDAQGNAHQQIGTYTNTNNQTRAVEDIWFTADLAYTRETTLVTVSAEIAALPNVAGFGNVHSLHQAMALDASGQLTGLVKQWIAAVPGSAERDDLLLNIIYHWVGVQDVNPASRANQYYNAMDARKLIVLENFLGKGYLGTWCWGTRDPNPNGNAAVVLLQGFNTLSAWINSQLLAQNDFIPLYDSIGLTWDTANNSFGLDVSQIVAQFHDRYNANANYAAAFMKQFAEYLQTQGQLGQTLITDLQQAGNINGSGFELSLATFGQTVGDNNNNTLTGDEKNNALFGFGGDDYLYGNAGDDVLVGGIGNDFLSGGAGNDTYRFDSGFGHDVIDNNDSGTNKTDTIEFTAGISPANVIAKRYNNDLILTFSNNATDQLVVGNYFDQDAAGAYKVEQIKFADNTIWDVAKVKQRVSTPTDGDDHLYGYATNDTLTGGKGNDYLAAGEGNDIYYFDTGFGQDIINNYSAGTNKTDTIKFSANILAANVVIRRFNDDLIINLTNSQDQITLQNYFAGAAYQIEQIQFSDTKNTLWNKAEILRRSLLGTNFKDFLYGDEQNNNLNGLGDDDTLYGYAGSDTLNGGAGQDFLDGGTGADTLIGGADNDTYIIDDINDKITEYSTGGIDTVYSSVNYTLGSNLENLILTGDANSAIGNALSNTIAFTYAANNTIAGGAGNDLIQTNDRGNSYYGYRYASAAQSNTFTGGTGNDTINSTGSADTYIFNRGDGQDIINDYGYYTWGDAGADQIKFGAGITSSNLSVSRNNDDLVVKIKNPSNASANDQITIQNWFYYDYYKIEQFVFADGSKLTADQLTVLGNIIVGTENADTLTGFDANNMILGLGGNDTITDPSGDDTINGGAGNDSITDTDGTNLLIGGEGNDTITFGFSANNTITGDAGDDVIQTNDTYSWRRYASAAQSNAFTGGTGNDTINSTGSADTYIFNRGDGQDIINDYGYYTWGGAGADQIKFGEGITAGHLTMSRNANNDLVVKIKDPNNATANDQITVQNWFSNDYYKIEQFVFADGSKLTSEQLTQQGNQIFGTENADTLKGWDDIGNSISGLGGDDAISGSWYNDTLNGNEGNDAITDLGGDDTINGGAGDDSIIDQNNGTNLLIGGDGNDTVTFSYYANNTITGDAGDDLIQKDENRYGNLYSSAAQNNTFYGGTGNDTIKSGGSTDTYLFNRGDGQDIIFDYGEGNWAAAGADQIKFGAGITEDNLTVSHNANDLVIKIKDSTDQITLQNWFYGNTYQIEQLVFADGSKLTADQLTALGNIVYGTENADTLTGFYENNTILGLGGNDIITDPSGDDTINGGAGNDSITDTEGTNLLIGGEGNDVITFGYSANNTITGDAGDDLIQKNENRYSSLYSSAAQSNTFSGGAGNDTIKSGGSADTYLFNRGDGQDTILDDGNHYWWSTIGDDQIKFGVGITAIDLKVSRTETDLIVKIKDPNNASVNDQITVQSWYSNEIYKIEQFVFADGSKLTADQLTALGNIVYGTENSDSLIGFGENNIILGLGGDDTISDPYGDDTINGGAGNDIITDQNGGTNLLIGGDGNDKITFSYNANNTITGDAGDDIIQVDNINYGSATYSNTISGGVGNDTIKSGGSFDAYLFNRGDGQDIIVDSGYYASYYPVAVGSDKIQFGIGINANDLTLSRNNNDLVVKIRDLNNASANDQITIQNWFGDVIYKIEQFTFADGSSLDSFQFGTDAADVLTGTDKNDYIDGGLGADTLTGGKGNDVYLVDNVGDKITENANEGTDTVQSSITYTLGTTLENLTLTGSDATNALGNAANNILIGNSATNTLTGNAGDDTLDGGLGADTLIGGTGNDLYIVDNIGDVITESASQGTDIVQSSVTYTLAINLENLTLTGSSAINATGNTAVNIITGNTANNILNGGTGADTLIGGLGDDTYVIDNVGDKITENANEGIDTVQSSITYTLGNTLENLTLTGSGLINGIGNSLNNSITGNSAVNTLSGGVGDDLLNGGAGADTLIGGLGNDTYVVDNISDVIIEYSNEGIDLIQSSVTYTASANVENLTLTGSGLISATGNTAVNIITGNTANNILNGGAGADTLIGGLGDDTYVIDNTGDKITENLNEGIDLIQSSATYTLSANVENLTLTGTAAINATGNASNNTLSGNTANNTLTGGAGNDTYLFNVGGAKDTIIDASGNDTLIFGAGINANQLWLQHTGNNLVLTRIGTADTVTIKDWYLQTTTNNTHVETLKSGDGKVLLDAAVESLVQAMAGYAPPASGQTTLPSNYQTALNALIAASWK